MLWLDLKRQEDFLSHDFCATWAGRRTQHPREMREQQGTDDEAARPGGMQKAWLQEPPPAQGAHPAALLPSNPLPTQGTDPKRVGTGLEPVPVGR